MSQPTMCSVAFFNVRDTVLNAYQTIITNAKTCEAVTGLDRESAHPLQLHAMKQSWCTAANPGATGRLSPWVGMTNRLSCLLKGITDLLHLGLQLYTSFASRREAATGGLIPYPIQ